MAIRQLHYRYKIYLNHIFGWLVFILYDTGYSYYLVGHTGPLADMLFFYTCNISLFYVHAYLLQQTMGEKTKYLLLVSCTLTELALYTGIKACWELVRLPPAADFQHPPPGFSKALINDLVRNIYYAGLSTLVWSSGHIANFRRKSAEAEIRRLELSGKNAEVEARLSQVENAYLQQQINPHLLFNTLTFIYNSVYKNSPEESRVVLLLAEIMRFSLDGAGSDGKVALLQEIRQLENLVAINRSRFHYPLQLEMELDNGTQDYRIIPLVLMTLAENMFKHGDFCGKPAGISLSIDEKNVLQFSTFNFKRPGSENEQAKKIGLTNIRLRLDHAYPSAYTLTTDETAETYRAILILIL